MFSFTAPAVKPKLSVRNCLQLYRLRAERLPSRELFCCREPVPSLPDNILFSRALRTARGEAVPSECGLQPRGPGGLWLRTAGSGFRSSRVPSRTAHSRFFLCVCLVCNGRSGRRFAAPSRPRTVCPHSVQLSARSAPRGLPVCGQNGQTHYARSVDSY